MRGSPCYLVLLVWVTDVNLDSRSGHKNICSVCNNAMCITAATHLGVGNILLPRVIGAICRSCIHANFFEATARRVLGKRRSGEFRAGFSQSHNRYPSAIESTLYILSVIVKAKFG